MISGKFGIPLYKPQRMWYNTTMRNDMDIISDLMTLAGDQPVDVTRARLAAALIYKNKVVAYGFNSLKSSPWQVKYGRNPDSIFLHAETDCLYRSVRRLDDRELSKSTLYVARVKKVSPFTPALVSGLAKPCSGCMRAIVQHRIRRVIYTLDNGELGEYNRV